MVESKLRLKILGKLSKDISKDYLNTFHKGAMLPNNHAVLFCWGSSFDIPFSHRFTAISFESKILYKGEIKIFNITQQFFKPFECIPRGWGTICEFGFSQVIPKVILDLPEIDEWLEITELGDVYFS